MIERLLLEEELRQSRALLDQAQVDAIADLVMDLAKSGMFARAPGVRSGKPTGTLIGGKAALCSPGHEAEAARNRFLVKFDDPDVHDQAFDDEVCARAFFAAARENWNCYLFGLMERRNG